MSELLPIDSPLLPRLRKAAAKDEEALRWLMDSARHWARGEFLRREMEGKAPLWPEQVRTDVYALELTQVAVRFGPLSDLGRRVDNERTAVGLLCEGCNEEYLDLYVGREEKVSGMFRIHDVFLLPPEFRAARWIRPAPPPPSPPVAENVGLQAQQFAASGRLMHPGDQITITETVQFS